MEHREPDMSDIRNIYHNLRAKEPLPEIAVHGNGFLLVPVGPTTRLHIWHPNVPKQVNPTPIHDHRFSFRSRVLVGELLNIIYREVDGTTYSVHVCVPTHGVNTELVPRGQTIGLEVASQTRYPMGWSYDMPKFLFHETLCSVPTATLMTKTEIVEQHIPRVLVPAGMTPSNDFDRHEQITQEVAWAIVEAVMLSGDTNGS